MSPDPFWEIIISPDRLEAPAFRIQVVLIEDKGSNVVFYTKNSVSNHLVVNCYAAALRTSLRYAIVKYT